MAARLTETETRLLAVIPVESTIDRDSHVHAVASVVFVATRQAARRAEAHTARAIAPQVPASPLSARRDPV
jgi:hypothetical protein